MAINLNDKTNKSIAALASKIMQEQPTKVREFTDTKPIESDMVQRVINSGLKGNFIKEETKSVWDTSVDVKAHGDEKPTHTVHLIQHPKGSSGWRGSPRTLKVHVAAKDDAEAIQHATTAASHHHDSSHDGEKWEKPFVPSNPMMIAHPVQRLKEEEQVDESRGAEKLGDILDSDADHSTKLKRIAIAPTAHLKYLHKYNMGQSGGGDHPMISHIKKELAKRSMKEEAAQIDEGRFGKAIDPKKLSKEAQARLAARAAANKPVEAKPGTKLGDIAASFKKPEPKKEEPKEEPKPAAKSGNKFTELRRQNMERQKAHLAAVASGKVGGGGDQRSGGKLGSPGDVEKKGSEIKGDRGAEHAARTGEKTAGSVVSGTTKAQSERNKRKKGPESDEHEDMHEALKGKQHEIDANHNGRIDGQDFKLLRAKHKRGK